MKSPASAKPARGRPSRLLGRQARKGFFVHGNFLSQDLISDCFPFTLYPEVSASLKTNQAD